MNKSIQNSDEQLGFLLMQVTFLKQRLVNSALRKRDITYIQFVILAAALELGEEGKPVTQQTIADERRLDKAMVSNVVKTLVAKGYLRREGHPTDKRAFTLELTDPGKELALEGKKIARQIDTGFFEGIDQSAFQESLKALLKNNIKRNE